MVELIKKYQSKEENEDIDPRWEKLNKLN